MIESINSPPAIKDKGFFFKKNIYIYKGAKETERTAQHLTTTMMTMMTMTTTRKEKGEGERERDGGFFF